MRIVELPEIKRVINLATDLEDLIASQKAAFIDFSSGLYDVPIPMQFVFPGYRSDCHIKGGYRQGSKDLVIKIVNDGPFGSNGIILVFAVDTGMVKIILQDKGFLTTLRTAIAGVIVSELISFRTRNIGIIGSGNLAKMLYDLVRLKYPNVNIMLYARNQFKAVDITNNVCASAEDIIAKCDLIFTATSAKSPVIQNIDSTANKTIIALGSDDQYKRELSLDIFDKSDVVIVDSRIQALSIGDVAKAITSGVISSNSLIEFGSILRSGIPGNAGIIVADFSGIGAQDVAMTEFILSRLLI